MKKIITILLLCINFVSNAQIDKKNPVGGGTPINNNGSSYDSTFFEKTNSTSSTNSIQTPTGTSTEVGITEGSLSVSLMGAATYNIPIAVPPGINGVVPQVSLAYSSQAGNGMAGYGWNITGISTISRIPSTKFHDNLIDAVNFDASDRFALDGQRLILKTGAYGGNGATYETENFSNVKITSYGINSNGANYGPAYFVVEYPDGSVAQYGSSTNSLSITIWAISFWQNPQGVKISYNYNLVTNNCIVSSIDYGTVTGVTPINSVQFIYKSRNRVEQAFVGGSSVINDKILDKINIVGSGSIIKRYELAYNATSMGYERLISITEKNSDGTKALNPTIFNYDTTSKTASYTTTTTTLANLGSIDLTDAATVGGDYDGDGGMDFLVYPTTGSMTKNKFWVFNNINGSSSNIGYGPVDIGKFEEIFSSSWLTYQNKLSPQQGISVIQNDTSVLGRVQFKTLAYDSSNVYLQYSKQFDFPNYDLGDGIPNYNLCNYSPIKSISKNYFNGDFNGDGLTDVIAIERNTTYNKYGACNCCDALGNFYYVPGTPVSYTGGKSYFIDLDRRITSTTLVETGTINIEDKKVMVADANGDGKSDLLVFSSGSVSVYSLNAASNQMQLLWTYSDANISIDSALTILIGDYNGDGKSDFLIPRGVAYFDWYKYLSTGTTFSKTTNTFEYENYSSHEDALSVHTYIATDFNNDGKTDIIRMSGHRYSNNTSGYLSIACYINNGGTVGLSSPDVYYGISSDSADITKYALPFFYNNSQYNQKMEVGFIMNNKIHYFQSQKDFNKDHLLKQVITGNGVTESITYSPLISSSSSNAQTALYKDSQYSELYPNFDIVSSPTYQFVSKIEKTASNGYYKRQLYKYYGAVSNVEGLGFLGFRAIMKTNWHDDTHYVISDISKFNIALRGALSENFTITNTGWPSMDLGTPGSFITRNFATYNTTAGVFNSPLQSNKVFKLQNTYSQNLNGLESTSSETSSVYDVYNNPTQTTTTIKNGTNTEQITNITIGYDNQPALSPYYIGRPISKYQETTLYPSQPNQDYTNSNELYYYTNNLLTKIRKKGYLTPFLVEENEYDTYGNITKKTIRPEDPNTPAGKTTFSSATNPNAPINNAIANPVEASRITNYEYNSTYGGRFLTKSYDIEGLATEYVYNANTGSLTSELKPSNSGYPLLTSYIYDDWGKKTKTTDYLGNKVVFDYARNVEKTLITTTGDDGSISTELYDDLGRKLKSGNKNINATWVYIDNLYDLYDRNYKTSEPYFGTAASQWNETKYDGFGRVNQTIAFTTKTTNIQYNGLITTVSDGTKTKTSTKNALGKVITMTDDPIGGTINYTYYANGNLKNTNYDGIITSITQDGWGRKTAMTDPSAGTYQYTYNIYGETTTEVTPNGTTTYKLDNYGKITTKTVVGTLTNSKTTNTYDPTTKLLTAVVFQDILNSVSTNYAYGYDNYKRLVSTDENGVQANFHGETVYDSFGRSYRERYLATNNIGVVKSSDKWIKNVYINGYHSKILDDTTSAVLWQTSTVNARGQLLTANYNGAIGLESHTYDAYGRPAADSFSSSGTSFMSLTTGFDQTRGNLMSRSNNNFTWSENFTYDAQDRLLTYKDATSNYITQSYDDKGRITANSTGTFNFGNAASPYRATSVDATPANFNFYTGREQNITYNTFKAPVTITENNSETIDFLYNVDGSRSVMYYGGTQSDKNTRPLRKMYSADGTMEIKRNIATNAIEFITYIGGDGYTAPIVLKSDGTTQNYLYLHRDYQGSILAITNASGTVIEKRIYDAWGSLIKYWNNSGITTVPTTEGVMLLDRGYTGHEMLLGVGLINMNARLYDPKLHRFLAPDNYVQAPENTQSFNRYGYCWNNPLKYTDANGEWINIVIGAIIGGVVNWATHGFQFNAQGLGYFAVGAVAGALTAMGAAGVSSSLAGGSFWAGALGTSAALTATSSFFTGAVIGASGGLVGGFTSGLGNSLVNSQSFKDSFKNGIKEGVMGALTGGVIGGIAGGIDAVIDGRRFFDGAKVVRETAVPAYILPNLLQSSDASCQATVGASIDQSLGGNMTEMDVRNMMPDYDYTGSGAGDVPFWKEFAAKTGRNFEGYNNDLSSSAFSSFKSGGASNIRIVLSTNNHSLAVQSVTKVDVFKISGRIVTKYFYNVMDPAYGATRSISPNTIIHTFLIK